MIKPFQSTIEKSLLSDKNCDSWSLYLDKFSCYYGITLDDRGREQDETKANRLKDAIKFYDSEQQASCLTDAVKSKLNYFDHLKSQHESRYGSIELVNSTRLMVHLGRACVLENVGLYTDRTTGLPMIPGTAVKGVLSTWACWEQNQDKLQSGKHSDADKKRKDMAFQIFGDNSSEGSESAGEVVFLGGFPKSVPILELDLVNPHTEANGRNMERLTPNPFLTIASGSMWVFPFYVRSGADDPVSLLNQTKTWMTEAFTQYGIGAKVAAGYGQFRLPNQDDQKHQQEKAEEAKLIAVVAQKQAEEKNQRQKQQAENKAKMDSDYNEKSFENILKMRTSKGLWQNLKQEIEKLKKTENASWLEKFKKTSEGKDYKDLRKMEWYPK